MGRRTQSESEESQISLFGGEPAEESAPAAPKRKKENAAEPLQAVEAEFREWKTLSSWEDLFTGYDRLYAITYSSGIDFIEKVVSRFQYAEIIFGHEHAVGTEQAKLMAFSQKMVEELTQHFSTKELSGRIEGGSLRLYLAGSIVSHAKIYILQADATEDAPARYRVITGSANLSHTAFNGVQRENIVYMDGEKAFTRYYQYYEKFRSTCSDHITPQQIRGKLLSEDDSADLDRIPLFNASKEGAAVILVKPDEGEGGVDEQQIICSAENLSKEFHKALNKNTESREGKTVITPENAVRIKGELSRITAERKKDAPVLPPKLTVDPDCHTADFRGKALDLSPDPETVRSDLRLFTSYMAGFDSFSGDVKSSKRNYYKLLVWAFASPFYPYLRKAASETGWPPYIFPTYAIIYGKSNGGKTSFASLILRMMAGEDVRVLPAEPNFTSINASAIMSQCEGIPVVYDEVPNDRYSKYAEPLIKQDDFGLNGTFFRYSSVILTSNKVTTLKAEISKRAYACYINSGLDKDSALASAHNTLLNKNSITSSLYREYLARMFPRIDRLMDFMYEHKNRATDIASGENIPDVFRESSVVLAEIAGELLDEVPDYMREYTWFDLMGDRAAGQQAIREISGMWANDRESFEISREKNQLTYAASFEANNYVLKNLAQELPPSLDARVIGKKLILNLSQAEDFLEIDFSENAAEKEHPEAEPEKEHTGGEHPDVKPEESRPAREPEKKHGWFWRLFHRGSGKD